MFEIKLGKRVISFNYSVIAAINAFLKRGFYVTFQVLLRLKSGLRMLHLWQTFMIKSTQIVTTRLLPEAGEEVGVIYRDRPERMTCQRSILYLLSWRYAQGDDGIHHRLS